MGREGEDPRERKEEARISTCYAFKTCLLLALNFSIVKNLPGRGRAGGGIFSAAGAQ